MGSSKHSNTSTMISLSSIGPSSLHLDIAWPKSRPSKVCPSTRTSSLMCYAVKTPGIEADDRTEADLNYSGVFSSKLTTRPELKSTDW